MHLRAAVILLHTNGAPANKTTGGKTLSELTF